MELQSLSKQVFDVVSHLRPGLISLGMTPSGCQGQPDPHLAVPFSFEFEKAMLLFRAHHHACQRFWLYCYVY